MALTNRQRLGPTNSSSPAWGVAVLDSSIVVAFGLRNGLSACPAPNVGGSGSAGWTELGGQPAANPADGRAFIFARPGTGIGTDPINFGDGASYQWMVEEIAVPAGASAAAIIAAAASLTGTGNAGGASGFTLDVGDFLSAVGYAVMAQVAGGTGISSAFTTNFVTFAAGWTERYDGRRDSADSGSTPFVGLADAAPAGGTLDASAAWSTPSAGWSGWAGNAALFPDPAGPPGILIGAPSGGQW